MNDTPPRDSDLDAPGGHPPGEVLLGLLSDHLALAVKVQTLDHLARCPACAQIFQTMAADRESIWAELQPRHVPGLGVVLVERREPLPSTVTAGGELMPSLRQVFGFIGRYRFAMTAGVIVACTILTFLLVPLQRALAPRPELHPILAFSEDSQFRAAVESSAGELLWEGLLAYENREYGRAIDLLSSAEADEMLAMVRDIYLGSALAWNGDFPRAATTLEQVAQRQLPDPWESEALWTLFVSWQSTGEEARADSLLQVLVTEPGIVGQWARDWRERASNQ